jgi:hypothetical protein
MQASLWFALDAVAVKVKNVEKGLNSGRRSAGRNGKNNNCESLDHIKSLNSLL